MLDRIKWFRRKSLYIHIPFLLLLRTFGYVYHIFVWLVVLLRIRFLVNPQFVRSMNMNAIALCKRPFISHMQIVFQTFINVVHIREGTLRKCYKGRKRIKFSQRPKQYWLWLQFWITQINFNAISDSNFICSEVLITSTSLRGFSLTAKEFLSVRGFEYNIIEAIIFGAVRVGGNRTRRGTTISRTRLKTVKINIPMAVNTTCKRWVFYHIWYSREFKLTKTFYKLYKHELNSTNQRTVFY